jgi:HTH-type transcriptional regulator/antitoxin HigA
MSTIPPFDKKKYKKLLGQVLPCAIHTEEEYDRLCAIVYALGEKDAEQDLCAEEERITDLLATLIQAYDGAHYEENRPDISPLEFLKACMEHPDLRQKDLWEVFGSKGVTSEVLNGKRAISKTHAKKLAMLFKEDVGVFI